MKLVVITLVLDLQLHILGEFPHLLTLIYLLNTGKKTFTPNKATALKFTVETATVVKHFLYFYVKVLPLLEAL